jgi:hypothetical protein
MNLQVEKQTETAYHPVFWSILEDVPGGITLETADLKTTTTELKKGALLGESASTSGLYHLIKTAEAYASSSTTTVKVLKAHEFKVGDFVCNSVTSTAISSIDSTTSETYDEFTMVTALLVADGDKFYQGTSEGAVAANTAKKFTPSAFLRNNVKVLDYDSDGNVITLGNVAAGAVVRGTLNESLAPYAIPDTIKTDLTARLRFV